jgi:hypothetical protein
VVRAIVYMSAREALMWGLGDEGRGRGGEGVREEKDGTESSRRACARAPISQLEIRVQHGWCLSTIGWNNDGVVTIV